MNNESNKWVDRWKYFLNLFTHKRTVKSARITYQVIWNLVLIFFIVILLGGAFAGGIGAGYFASLVKDEPIRPYEKMKKEIYNYEETSELYFANDIYLGNLRTDLEREEVQIKDVSKYLVDAVVATEDEYFYDHSGVVPKAIFRALFQEVTNSSVQSGGSTLTQQLIKNQILTNEVSFERKAKEILLALRLEKFFKKEEILEAYLNVSPFGRNSSGRNIAGVQTAAKGIFGVNVKELTLPQAAFIAGLPQSPFGYTPFTNEGVLKSNLEPGLTRMKTVLKRMYDGGFISNKEYQNALTYDVTKDFIPPKSSSIEKYPWLTFEIEKRAIDILAVSLAEKDGYEEKDLKQNNELYEEYTTLANRNLRQNGYKIHSTIDKDIYDAMQKTKDAYPYYGPDKPQVVKDPDTGQDKTIQEPVEVGAILIENNTGKIISFVGGRDYSRAQVNHATYTKRQNGSTMKPLLVYGPAIELGKASPGSPLPDVELRLDPSNPDKPWPLNYDKHYNGLVSARYALAKSYNVPAIKLYRDIINERPAKYLEKMGFTSLLEPDYTNLSTAIGSLEQGVTVEENTNAFATFANGGKFVDAYLIDKILDKNGKVVYEHKTKSEEVFSPQTAYLTVDMMRDVIKRGTASAVNGRLKFQTDWAGKTGTGNEFFDSWFVASNPNVTFGIWTGYDHNKSLEIKRGLSYSMRTNYLWADLLNAAYDVNPELVDPVEPFKMPGGIVKRSICAVSGLLPSEACSRAGLVESDLFNMKYAPTEVDSSLIDGKYVQVGEKKYLALDSTPDEFAEHGLILNPDYMEQITGVKIPEPGQLIPKKDGWSKILVPNDKIQENGQIPDDPLISVSGNTISWAKDVEPDVIGYRIYNSKGEKVGIEKSGSDYAFDVKNGTYYVTAVDIAGQESPPSNVVEVGKPIQSDDPNSDEETDDNSKDKDKEIIDLVPFSNETKKPKSKN
ncbi:transglycosylase domain-containing protein [Neobacillus sp. D3-1R]|uniref:transglycosylase domain-containing protein n=1 Tax=Neobacillus sp. D3-1R TaxID=3445778 RepID=UPI003F9EC8A7